MKLKSILYIGAGMLLVSSCGTYKHTRQQLYAPYERPAVNTKGIFRDTLSFSRDTISLTDTLVATDTVSFGQMPWRSVFTDPYLRELIEKALVNNTDLLNAALNVKMAEEQLKVARLAFLPSITFAPSGTISSWDFGKVSKTYQLPLSASWNVNLFGGFLSQKRSAQAALLATQDYQTVVKTNIISAVANMYYTLLMLDSQLAVLDDMEQLTKDTWELMKLLKDTRVGYRSTSVQSAEANYLSVQSQRVDMVRQVREVENSLSLLLGQPAQAIPRGRLDDQSLPAELATGVAVSLLANRADVHAAEMQLAQCFYGIENARSRFYPNLTINPSGIFTNSAGVGVVNPGKILLSAVGSLAQPIFMNGQLKAGLRVAEAQYEQAYNTWQQSILTAGSEVSNALVQYQAADEKGSIEARQIEVLKQNVADIKTLMTRASGTTYLEVIQAQSSLLNAQISKITDDFNKMQAVVNLYQALGGGVK
ncbi:MAG: efflux transporter outer membrane subunit [Prevotella sp.]|nr:efflux transporter outer membrane subunit [Prevotella sp.]